MTVPDERLKYVFKNNVSIKIPIKAAAIHQFLSEKEGFFSVNVFFVETCFVSYEMVFFVYALFLIFISPKERG